MAEVTELVTRFGFQGSTQPLQQYNAQLGKSIGLLGGMTAALGLAGGAMRKFTTDTLAGVDSLIDMGTETQNSVQDIRELGFMAQQSGGSVQAMEGTISSLSSSIRDAALNGSEDFARLGISIRDNNGALKDSVQVFEEARDRLSQMDLQTAERQNLAEAIGIDPSLIRLLEMGNQQYAELRRNARQYGVITEDNKETILAYNNAQTEMTFAMQSLKTLVAVGMAPTMQRLSGIVSELIAENKDWIVNGLQAGAKWVGNFFAMLSRLMPIIQMAVAVFVAWKVAAIALAVAASPVIALPALIAAGIVYLLLVIDDLIVAFRGGQSVIADFFQEFYGWDIQPVLQGIVEGFQRAMAGVLNILGALWSVFRDLSRALAALFRGDFEGVGEALLSAFTTIRDAIWDLFTALFGWVRDAALGVANFIKSVWNENLMENSDPRGANFANPTRINPWDTQGASGGFRGGDVNINQNNRFDIQSPNAESAGRQVSKALGRQLRDADQHTRGGN